MNRCSRLGIWIGLCGLTAVLLGGTPGSAHGQGVPDKIKGQSLKELMSSGGFAALTHATKGGFSRRALPGGEEEEGSVIPKENVLTAEPKEGTAPFGNRGGGGNEGGGGNRRFRNAFVNDPCLDPPPEAPFPENFLRTVQSEDEIAVLNDVANSHRDEAKHGDEDKRGGRLMVAGYNDSYGFYDNRQGLSGFSYSTNGGKQWIDAGGLPPKSENDLYFGDPVVVVHHPSKTFYYSSVYLSEGGYFTLSVNRGQFKVAPQQVPIESKANTRCKGNPAKFGIPDPPPFIRERIIWEPPVEAVLPPFVGGDEFQLLDKEWLYVDQNTGYLYLTYTRFNFVTGATPLEMVRSFDGGRTWTPPSVIVPNLLDTFNQATQSVVTPTGRVIVSWLAITFEVPAFVERQQRVEVAYSDNGGNSFGPPTIVAYVNPQGEPPGYNRGEPEILNVPYLMVDKGRDDGKMTKEEMKRRDFGNVYLTYFDGLTPFAPPGTPNPAFERAAEIHLSRSTTNGTTWGPEKKVNDDHTRTSHVFSSVQVNQAGLVFVTWIDRRVDPDRNLLSDTYGDVSRNRGQSFERDVRLSDVSTDWIARADAAPNFGDYNSSEVINFTDFASIWADGRFPKPAPLTPTPDGGYTRPADEAATPDTFFEIFGDGSGHGGDD
jgi:hypothetical protein